MIPIEELIQYFCGVAKQLRYKSNLLWYALDYPFDWDNQSYAQVVSSSKYRNQLQNIINNVSSADNHHSIYLVSGMIETTIVPPTDFDKIEGFGIMPYSQSIDEIEENKIKNWLDIYRGTGKKVYIAEWGVQTKEASGSDAKYNYGWATNESMKVKMIGEFIDYIYTWDIYWDYFGLHNFHLENSDWGIVYDNNSLKSSGEFIMKKLTGNEQLSITDFCYIVKSDSTNFFQPKIPCFLRKENKNLT